MEWARGGGRRCGGRLLETKEKVENQQHEEERCWCYCEGVHSLLETSEAIILHYVPGTIQAIDTTGSIPVPW